MFEMDFLVLLDGGFLDDNPGVSNETNDESTHVDAVTMWQSKGSMDFTSSPDQKLAETWRLQQKISFVFLSTFLLRGTEVTDRLQEKNSRRAVYAHYKRE